MLEKDKVYYQDCLEGMKLIEDKSVDCIICDLPYGVLNKNNKDAQWDKIIPLEKLWEQYERIIKENGAIILFAQGMFTARLMMSNPILWKYNLILKKGEWVTGFLNARRMPLRNHEDICVFYRKTPTYNPQMEKGFPVHLRTRKGGDTTNRCYNNIDFSKKKEILTEDKFPKSIINIRKGDGKWYHPTQKPVELVRYLIRTYSNKGDLILDNCIGSGTTAIAAIREQRHFLGFETDKKFFQIAEERIAKELFQPTL